MEEILDSKAKSCPEFRQALINSVGMRLVEAVKSDIYWSSGLNSHDASTTKTLYYPGQNQLGQLLEHIRTKVINDENGNGKAPYHVIEPIKPPPESEKPVHSSIITTPMNSPHDDQPTTSTSDNISTTDVNITPSTLDVPSTSSSTQLALLLPEHIQETPVSKSIHIDTSLLPDNNDLIDHDKDSTNDSRAPDNTGSQNKMRTSTTPQTKTKVQRKKQQRPSNKSNIHINKVVHEQSLASITPNKGQFMMSWVKRKLTPDKEATSQNIVKQPRNDNTNK